MFKYTGLVHLAHGNKTQILRQYTSTALHFYQNRQLELFASREAKRLTLRQLVYFGRQMDEKKLITSANYVRTELPVRIAHRLRDIQTLPYVVVTQEGVAKVYELYWSAFDKFRQYPPIKTLEENEAFCRFIATLLHEHAPVIPSLSLGLSLSSHYLPPDKLDDFMRRMLISRISRRVLAEHHIALSKGFLERTQMPPSNEPHVGIIFTGLNIKRCVEHCATLLNESPLLFADSPVDIDSSRRPAVLIDGHVETTFSYIREHLEYIIFELLKNSMRATYTKHLHKATLPPIQVTIVAGENNIAIRISDQGKEFLLAVYLSKPSDLFSFSHVRNATRLDDSRLGALRTASQSEQGLRATVDEQIGSWQKFRGKDLKDSHTPPVQVIHPRIGIGLPMSYIYATYFGGKLELVSLDGWGIDVYLRLPKLGTNLEGIEV
ncbi:alpha-ketoacid dehydrogenase kinase [Pholiota conissans]|uniref:Protein-serine/threonine kinase n=1 Tax=Pholiota conissans TaxID=109636 RepID=A0A9P5ZE58_9AGAR|nr:alpha-ketoacid dehydrogenase kinase [Pholiota conissans]